MIDSDAKLARVRQHCEAGELIEASEFVDEWLMLAPADANAAVARAQVLRLCGRLQEARAWLDRALSAPTGAAYVEAARLAIQSGEPARALDHFESAHRAMPDATDWLGEWMAVAHQCGRADIGIEAAKRWSELASGSVDAWFSLGLIQQHSGAYDASLRAYERAMTLDPQHPMLRNNLAALHYTRGEYELALSIGEEAVRAEPVNHLAWTNVANAWLQMREPAKALVAARRAATLAPKDRLALLALSNAAREVQQWDEAFDAIVRAAHVSGGDPLIQFSVAMLQLMQGDFRNGWINFEARWRGSPELRASRGFCPERRWHGETLAGKTLLIWGEQGHGDAIQFVRFVPLIARLARDAGGSVICCCFPPLLELFRRSLDGHGVLWLRSDVQQLPAFDYQVPLASLPLELGITIESLPAPVSYLSADETKVIRTRDRMPAGGALKVGLAWTGSRTHQRNPLRAVAPELFAQAFSGYAGAEFYSLQKDASDDVARMKAAGLHMIDRTGELESFDDTASLVASLDLVVTVCTSVAHLAAALGRPTWLLVDGNPHWVWMTGRRDSVWYPTVRLYRQRAYRDWCAPLQELAADLRQMAGAGARPGEGETVRL